MKKLTYIGIGLATLFASCRPDVRLAVKQPTADSFSPAAAKTGDTVTVIGSALSGAKVLLDGVEIPTITNTEGVLAFVVTDNLSANKSIMPLAIQFSNGIKTTFSQSIILNYVVKVEDISTGSWLNPYTPALKIGDTLRGPSQLLLTDFDGHGVRTANATAKFNETQWTALVKTGGTQLITRNFLGAQKPSPMKDNYLATQLNPEFLQKGTSGYSGEFISATDVQNNRSDAWPANFSALPSSPIIVPTRNTSSTLSTDLADTYLNFFLYKNGKDKSLVRPYLTNDLLSGGEEFANNIADTDGNAEWKLISIPFRNFKAGYGFGTAMAFGDYSAISKVKFNFTHLDWKDDANVTPVGDVQIYIDHIIITQGGPLVVPPANQ